MAREYNLFISHSWNHDDILQGLKDLINSHVYFPANYTQIEKNCPIDSDQAWVIRANIIKQLKDSDVVLAIEGIYASSSEWMQWEMDQARNLGLKVIGVIPRGQERISTEVFNRSVKDVHWNADSIVEAIREYSKNCK